MSLCREIAAPLEVVSELFKNRSDRAKRSSDFSISAHFAAELSRDGADEQVNLFCWYRINMNMVDYHDPRADPLTLLGQRQNASRSQPCPSQGHGAGDILIFHYQCISQHKTPCIGPGRSEGPADVEDTFV